MTKSSGAVFPRITFCLSDCGCIDLLGEASILILSGETSECVALDDQLCDVRSD